MEMTQKSDPHSLIDSLRENAADCFRQAEVEKERQVREGLKGLARSYLKIADKVAKRRQAQSA